MFQHKTFQKTFPALLLLFSLSLTDVHFVSGQNNEGKLPELNRKVVELYKAEKYAEALPYARKALQIAEKEFGPDHPDVTTSLNNLAALYDTIGDYDKAEPLYRRSLKIREKYWVLIIPMSSHPSTTWRGSMTP